MSMEQIEVPSGSYLLRWVECSPGETIQWSLTPHKKSLNFGLVRHPGSNPQPPSTSHSGDSVASTIRAAKTSSTTRHEGDAKEKLSAAGLQTILWHGRCEPEKVTTGSYAAAKGGMYALVFDNTFSRQISKTATFVLLTYPSDAPPPASHATLLGSPEPSSTPQTELDALPAAFYTGVLKKRKRKRHQGYARRFFSLDFTSCTLSYYLNRESSALRGAIPLSLAAISASRKDREICIDSGAEIWHLRANSDKDWEAWKAALERAADAAAKAGTTGDFKLSGGSRLARDVEPVGQHGAMEERGWAGVEALVGRISGIRDAVRRLASTADSPGSLGAAMGSEAASSSTSVVSAESVEKSSTAKKPFWKRKSSAPTLHPREARDAPRKSISAAAAFAATSVTVSVPVVSGIPRQHTQQDMSMHLRALLTDLDSVVADFSALVAQNKQRRWLTHRMSGQVGHLPDIAASRVSIDSTTSEEFFDAEDAPDRVVMLNDDEDGDTSEVESITAHDQATDDEESDEDGERFNDTVQLQPSAPTPSASTDLSPLPLSPVPRRSAIPEPKVLPPSLIGFLRKNVGKDLSTIAMPVSANEPISLLQRSAEQLEYSALLDAATSAPQDTGEQLLLIAAFAISSFSSSRDKVRSIRKPFNPLLGETYELIREDRSFRLIAEKVCHRPLVMAMHAQSPHWSLSQSAQPTQKFWGKSAELNTSGRVRITFHRTGDTFSYAPATSFLRNIIAGEKYVEPTGTLHIHHETTGARATAVFKAAKGMFAGRSEDVDVSALRPDGTPYPLTAAGTWTKSLSLSDSRPLWAVADKHTAAYGFPVFAAQLNEITPIERGRCAPTDSRLRPDQRLLEDGDLDRAAALKDELERWQRERRGDMEAAGERWSARWFTKVREQADEEIWTVVEGAEGYWGVRERGNGWGVEKGKEIF